MTKRDKTLHQHGDISLRRVMLWPVAAMNLKRGYHLMIFTPSSITSSSDDFITLRMYRDMIGAA